ncbi:DUF4345 domain-containing protein [Mycobacterium sp. SMC-4]|uniref:DUF4345 domain-containing protein n=1 Tax=Mycobacterium sp. SMC-4 TaxID=2857059 RepID=UPI0021B42E6A|nr:DUF4345 domain-containing protein [Mycobacterium sp. SMC-4]UXA20655.1 DUF4345 domain-containing protein [Mycobacterium sp. SMC-4]
MAATVLVVAALFFAAMGTYALVVPTRLTAPFDITLGSAVARSEVRAVYGGFGWAIAVMLMVAVADPQLRAGIVITVAAALAGMAAGRVLSALDGRTAFYPNWFYFLVEIIVAVALFSVA